MLQFLKLGGSLITEKDRPSTVRRDTLARLATEIKIAVSKNPSGQLVIGHGSGSFGHYAGNKHGTRNGVHTKSQWDGFVEVYKEARRLNQYVLDALLSASLPVIGFPPSGSVMADHGLIQSWDIQAMESALSAGLIPVTNGDVIFDTGLGGTILSTEELFSYLANRLHPKRILLAGIEPGVWSDYPACNQLLKEITPQTIQSMDGISSSASVDVTGGMRKKVESMLQLCLHQPGLEVLIFSGEISGITQSALEGESPGTILRVLRS